MADAKSQNEPSMEEILASIRQIISEDGKDESAAEDEEAQTAESEPAPLDLTQVVNEDGSVTEISASPPSRLRDFQAASAALDSFGEGRDREAEGALPDLGDEPGPVQDLETEPEPARVFSRNEEPALAETSEETEAPGVPLDEDIRIETMAMDPGEPRAKEGLLSDEPAQTIGSALARLSGQTRLRREPDPATVEGLVQELLRPMLKQWLDENLPRMVERLVREEIERLTKRID